MIKRVAIAGAAAVALFALGAWGGLTRVETTDSLVALTFDDGPIPIYTDSVLDMLGEFGVPATFFMVGASIKGNPDLAAEVVRRGHEVGNHSFSHRRLVLKTPRTIRREIEDTDALIRAAGRVGAILVRPPYGKRLIGLPLYLSRRERPVVLADLEPDSYRSNADDMVRYVEERVKPGSIILLHVEMPSRSQNRQALRRIVPSLMSRGYRFVTVSELLAEAPTSR